MTKIIDLKPGEDPPATEPFLLLKWRPDDGVTTDTHALGVTEWVSSRLWNVTLAQAPELAERLGLSKIYVSRPPGA